jgi:hypothetical protein
MIKRKCIFYFSFFLNYIFSFDDFNDDFNKGVIINSFLQCLESSTSIKFFLKNNKGKKDRLYCFDNFIYKGNFQSYYLLESNNRLNELLIQNIREQGGVKVERKHTYFFMSFNYSKWKGIQNSIKNNFEEVPYEEKQRILDQWKSI